MFATSLLSRLGAPLLVALALLFSTIEPSTAKGQMSPAQLVGNFHSALLSVMKEAEDLGFDGRYERLAPQVEDTFHMRLMTQISSGSYWRKAPEAKKQALVAAFSKVSVGTYAARFDGFSGQSFETVETKPGPQGTQLVATRLINPSGSDVDLTYVAKQVEGNWRVIDVILDSGISELAVRRSEYRKILSNGGIDSLIEALNDKAAGLRPS